MAAVAEISRGRNFLSWIHINDIECIGMFRKFALTAAILAPLFAWSQLNAQSDSEPPKDTAPAAPNQVEDSKSLIAIKTQRAVYPLQAQEKQIQGRVWLQVFINEAGDVEKVEVAEGNPALVDAAVSAMKKWKFKPYIKSGKAVKVNVKIPMDFAFSEKIDDPKTPITVGKSNSPSASGTSAADMQNGSAGPPPNAASISTPTRVRISQGVSTGLLIHRVSPIYPVEARRNRVQGKVLLRAVIGTDGNIKDLQVISGPKELVDPAVGAVQQWRYKP
ncbi:MAG TPA: energy transducer TonB, partial [Terriglobales bacterium]